jgi:hypothetical protein
MDEQQTDFDEQEFGSGLGLLDKLRLLAEWAPLLGRLQSITSAKTPHDQALAVVSTLQWAAGKSGTTLDDEALEHVESVLRTAEGKAAFQWVLNKLGGVA